MTPSQSVHRTPTHSHSQHASNSGTTSRKPRNRGRCIHTISQILQHSPQRHPRYRQSHPKHEVLRGPTVLTKSDQIERKASLDSANANFVTMYLEFVSRTGYNSKRLQFVTLITSASYSGLETIDLGVIDARAFDSCILKKLRCILLGRGYTSEYKNGRKDKWTNGQVWNPWRVIPSALELMIRRVKWFQDIARWPLANAQLLTSIFGHFPSSAPTLNQEYRVQPESNFAATNLVNDLSLLCKSECGHEL